MPTAEDIAFRPGKDQPVLTARAVPGVCVRPHIFRLMDRMVDLPVEEVRHNWETSRTSTAATPPRSGPRRSRDQT